MSRLFALSLCSAACLVSLVQSAGSSPSSFAEPAQSQGEKVGALDPYGDPLPPGVLARLGTSRLRLGKRIYFVGFAAGGKQLVTTGDDASACIWETATGKPLQRLSLGRSYGGGGSSSSTPYFTVVQKRADPLVQTSDGQTLATVAPNGRDILLWDLATGKKKNELVLEPGRTICLAFSADGKLLASKSADQTIQLWDMATGKAVRRIGKAERNAESLTLSDDNSVAFAADGKSISSFAMKPKDMSYNGAIAMLDVKTGNEIRQIKLPPQIFRIDFAPDGKSFIGMGVGGTRLFETATGKELHQFDKNSERIIAAVAFSPDSKIVALKAANAGVAVLYDLATGKALREVGAQGDFGLIASFGRGWEFPRDLAFSPDGKTLAVGTGQSSVRLWEVESGKEIVPAGGHHGHIVAICVAADGKTVTTAAADATLRQWDRATGKELRQIKLPAGAGPVALAPDGTSAVVGTPTNKLVVWNVQTGKEVRTIQLSDVDMQKRQLDRLPGGTGGLAFSADGRLFAVKDYNGMIRLWESATGKGAGEFSIKKPNSPAMTFVNGLSPGIALSQNGNVFTVGAADSKDNDDSMRSRDRAPNSVIRSWKVAGNGRQPRQLDTRQVEITAVTLTGDGRTLASAGADGTVSLWETATGKERGRLQVKGAAAVKNQQKIAKMSCLLFSSDGRFLAAGSEDGIVRLWEVRSGKQFGDLSGPQGSVRSLAFTPDARALLAGGVDTTVLVLDLAPHLPPVPALAEFTAKELEVLWNDLVADPEKAYQAVTALCRAPKQSVTLLQARLQPAVAVDSRRVQQLLDDLESDRFAVRKKAAEDLALLGELTEPHLKKVLAGQPNLDLRKRVEALLQGLAEPPAEELRRLRGLEVLEQIGNADARQLLEALSRGEDNARLTREAKASVERLARRH